MTDILTPIPAGTRLGERGTWWHSGDHAYVTCGRCAHVISLHGYRIDDDGKIDLPIVCVACGRLDGVRLVDWTPLIGAHLQNARAKDKLS